MGPGRATLARMSSNALSGRCHCGNLSVELRSARAAAELGARTCMCTFCRAHRLRWTSDAEGAVTITIAAEREL